MRRLLAVVLFLTIWLTSSDRFPGCTIASTNMLSNKLSTFPPLREIKPIIVRAWSWSATFSLLSPPTRRRAWKTRRENKTIRFRKRWLWPPPLLSRRNRQKRNIKLGCMTEMSTKIPWDFCPTGTLYHICKTFCTYYETGPRKFRPNGWDNHGCTVPLMTPSATCSDGYWIVTLSGLFNQGVTTRWWNEISE